ncbi:MAG: acetyl/propionyl/methylcrotonyl-CoA carboxylase subunit alpha [Amphiplicatus sp.]
MFRKILIANRGEIAVRVARTARRMGIATVAVYSDADKDAPHARACDEAVWIGGAAPADSYLRAERIIAAAKATGAEAVHPGYGFLSENADFAEALEAAGAVFIGPKPASIRAMGSKSAAKDLMAKAGVPVLPGYQGADQSPETFRREAARIGYPVLLKAAAGGGGKGMRLVEREADLEDALASARREAKSAFGDDRFLVEKYLVRPRHVEVQVFGDAHGNIVHLFERDCSAQRRHQKIIEEAPAPNLPAGTRARLLEAGVNAARAVDYVGAGTVEFLYDPDTDGVYFMEMNTRLQVEHPVTEAITGLDLVEWQLRIAAGEPLPLRQEEIAERGHAVEARLYAENPDQNFAPSTGTLTALRLPENLARVDSGVEEGMDVTPFYDPMIAKIVAHGDTRAQALARLAAALRAVRVAGPETNARFLHALATDARFAAGDVSTKLIEERREALLARPPRDERVLAAALLLRHLAARRGAGPDPWERLTGFRLNKPAKAACWIALDGRPALARLLHDGGAVEVVIEPDAGAAARREGAPAGAPIRFSFSGAPTARGVRMTVDGRTFEAEAAPHGDGLRIWIGADHWDVSFPDPLIGLASHHSAEGSLAAPMPGVVAMLAAKPGEAVKAGATLLVMEAMKMEHAVKAPIDGVVKAFRFRPGDQVKEGDLLVEFEEAE